MFIDGPAEEKREADGRKEGVLAIWLRSLDGICLGWVIIWTWSHCKVNWRRKKIELGGLIRSFTYSRQCVD